MIEYQLPDIQSGPAFLAIDSQDRIWFTQWLSNRIGMFDSETERFTEYVLPIRRPGPASIAIDSNDVIYFSTKELNAIVRLDSNDDVYFHIFRIPTRYSGQKDGLLVDEDGLIWFTEFDRDKIGRLKVMPTNELTIPGQSTKNRTLIEGQRVNAERLPYPPAIKESFSIKSLAEN